LAHPFFVFGHTLNPTHEEVSTSVT
jgi:hypothetical protein